MGVLCRRRPRALKLFSAAALVLVLSEPSDWVTLHYDGIAANEVAFTPSGLKIKVDGSSSPLVLPLAEAIRVGSVAVSGRFVGGPLQLDGAVQGEAGADDFVLRVGLVVPGGRELDFLERQLAPAWVLALADLAPEGLGLERVIFLNAVQDRSLIGTWRMHPASDLIVEHFVWQLDTDRVFAFQQSFSVPVVTQAIWIAVDGDDTGSAFTIEIDELVLKPD